MFHGGLLESLKSFKKDFRPPIVGWREWAGFPEWKVQKIKAKIDSGARTSSLHARDIIFFKRQGKKWARFKIYPEQRNSRLFKVVEAPFLEMRSVKSSDGVTSIRPVVLALLMLGGRSWTIELTLVNRDIMGFRMLIGRQALRKKYLIDSGRSFLQN